MRITERIGLFVQADPFCCMEIKRYHFATIDMKLNVLAGQEEQTGKNYEGDNVFPIFHEYAPYALP
jgi:hypothetical protein